MAESQLEMIRNNLNDLPQVVLPEDCSIRSYQPGDEVAWAAIMNTGIGEGWTVERVTAELISKPQFDPQGLYFVTMNGKIVGSACALRMTSEDNKMGMVHMVCILPEARGKNLGYLVTLQVLHRLRQIGCDKAYLSTDDFRIPAIKAYLRLGFEPLYTDHTHDKRWQLVMEQVAGCGVGNEQK